MSTRQKYHGVDLHRNSFLSCNVDVQGNEELKTWSIKKVKFFAEQLGPEDEVAVEATPGRAYVYCRGVV